jgi:tRNA(Arg) A34 adenosine deaminase TadA
MNHEYFMDMALKASEEAYGLGNWPVAAVIVRDGVVVGTGQNEMVTRKDITWHAENAAIRDAQSRLGTTDLSAATLYATMEPCPMCAWSIRLSGIRRMVLALRHATLRRTDMGSYSMEAFGRMVGWDFELVSGVREAEYLALRKRWGKDPVKKD